MAKLQQVTVTNVHDSGTVENGNCAVEGTVMSTSRATDVDLPDAEATAAEPTAEQREYSITSDRVDGIPRDFVADNDADEAAPSRFSEGARTVLLGVGFGIGFGLLIEGFRLVAWLIAPEATP